MKFVTLAFSKPRTTALAAAVLATASIGSIASAGPATAATERFSADTYQVRQICSREHQNFWQTKRQYGCGSTLHCSGGSCVRKVRYVPPTFEPPRKKREFLEERRALKADVGGGSGGGGGAGGGGRR